MKPETIFRLKGCALILPMAIVLAYKVISMGYVPEVAVAIALIVFGLMAAIGLVMLVNGEWPQD